jgi:uncharacterized cupredoxin-like copper-binding protein
VKKVIVLLAALALLLTACGGGSHDEHAGGGGGSSTDAPADHGSSEDGFAFGEAASADEATRTIEIDAVDAPDFEPSRVEVQEGDVVTFVVTNTGKSPHEFVLGDEAYQEEHHEMMTEGHGMAHGDNAVEVAPGDTAELTWRFAGTSDVLFACHVAGHYEAGMVGTVSIS